MKESLKGVKLLPKMRVSKAFENEGEENENRANKFFIQGELYLIKSVRMYLFYLQSKNHVITIFKYLRFFVRLSSLQPKSPLERSRLAKAYLCKDAG